MSLDITAAGIALGLLFSVTHSVFSLMNRRKLIVGTLWAVVAAGLAIPAGAKLIVAGFSGNPTDLPANWREYVAAAGAIAIGLAVNYLIRVMRTAVTREAPAASSETSQKP